MYFSDLEDKFGKDIKILGIRTPSKSNLKKKQFLGVNEEGASENNDKFPGKAICVEKPFLSHSEPQKLSNCESLKEKVDKPLKDMVISTNLRESSSRCSTA